jgi:hypothetical protein
MADTVDTMQQELEKALERANQADDRELSGRVREEGHRLVFLLNGLMRTSRLYHTDNAAFEAPTTEFTAVLSSLMELLGAVHVVCVEDQIYVNDVRLRVRPSEQGVVESLVAELGRHDVGGISFHRPLDPSGVKALAQALAGQAAESDHPRAALAARLASVGDVELSGRFRFRLGGEPTPVQRDYTEAVRRGASVVQEAMANLASARLPNPLPVRRAVIELVDSLKQDPGQGAAEPLRRRRLGVGEQHLLSVSSLSLLLGQAIGLSEGALSDLGVAAMLHDVGYTRTQERSAHTCEGARLLLRQRGFHEAKIRRLAVVLEHHLPYDSGSDPDGSTSAGVRPSLFARILHIADDYDVMTAPRPGQPPPLSPAWALASMWNARGSSYDPTLLALFARALGRFPPGTLLELSDGRWGLSVSGGRDRQRFGWPVVRIVRDSSGMLTDATEEVDLFEVRQRLRPHRILDPMAESLDIGEVLESAYGKEEEAAH